MHRSGWARLLMALVPTAARRDMFEPALHDLYSDAARTGRGTALATLGLFLECWRLAPAEVMTMFLHDVRHALRLLLREPGFTIAALLTLTLGVGANVAVFAVVNAALLRPLPYPDADRLVLLEHRDRRTGIKKDFVAIGDFVDLRARQKSFESLGAFGGGRGTIFDAGEPFDVAVLQATPDLLAALPARAVLGRMLTPDDARQGAAPVVVLGHVLWQQRFAGDPSTVGRSIKLNVATLQVVGVAAPGFRFPANGRTDAIVPMHVPAQSPAQRKNGWVFAAGRLKPGVTMERAAAELTAISRQMEQEFPGTNAGSEYVGRNVREAMVGSSRRALLLLLAAVCLVMLIACVNVANLLVARAVGRRQEMAVRVALGAGRGRLVAQALAESLVLAIVSGIAAVLFARWATPALMTLMPISMPLPELAGTGIDTTVLTYTVVLTAVTTILFAMISALGMRSDNAAAALVNPGRVTASAAARRAASVLVVAETALAIVLLTGAGLVLRSFSRLISIDPGFKTEGVLTMDIALPADRYREASARSVFYRRAFEDLARLDAVESVGSGVVTPLTGNNWTVPLDRSDRPVPAGQRPPDVGWQAATGGYFSALQIPLRAGRLFSSTDRPGGPTVVIISEAIQERFFPGENPVGRRIRGGDGEAEIVGVVGNIRRAALTDQPRADMYFAAEQGPQTETTLFIRTAGDPREAVAVVRAALRAIEPRIVLRRIETLEDVARESIQLTSLTLWLLGIFAASALALAAVGIYGVMSYAVRQRTREIGTRLALGATSGNILWMVMRHGIVVAGVGCAIGVVAGLLAARSLSALLYDTSTADPATLAGAVAILLSVSLLACYLPARRATRVDPVETLIAR
ncbi:MAG: ABC transporter permease [Vicinamibacterales bacterium]